MQKEPKNKKLKIALIGLGAVGSVIARLGQKDNQVEKITCFTRNSKKVAIFLPDGKRKISLKEINLPKDRKRLAGEIKGYDVVINAASYFLNPIIMEAAFKAGVNYLDLASAIPEFDRAEQFKFNKKFKRKNLKALICAGVAPGISNLLVRELAEKFDSITDIKIRLAESTISQDIISSWAPDLVVEELSALIPVYKNNSFILKKPFSEEEIYEYPPPFGKMPATLLCQDELVTIPLYIKTKNLDVKSGGSDIEIMKLFYNLGLFSSKKISIHGSKIKPVELLMKIMPPTPSPQEMINILKKGRIKDAIFGIIAEIFGKKKGKKERIKRWLICPSIFEINKLMPGATYISYPTGLAAYLFMKKLKGADFSGIIPPEALDSKIGSSVLWDFIREGHIKTGMKKF